MQFLPFVSKKVKKQWTLDGSDLAYVLLIDDVFLQESTVTKLTQSIDTIGVVKPAWNDNRRITPSW
jgi:hypothetical protein